LSRTYAIMKKTALITGATSGIGLACARTFARQQYRLILTGRRQERLERIQAELTGEYGTEVLILAFDVRNEPEVTQHLGTLPVEWQDIDVLVNNAGLAAGRANIDEGDLADWEQMIDTNVKGLLYVSRAVIPGMKARKQGHIVNLGSIAGKEAYLGGNVYCATKHAVDALTKSMRIDLLPYKIKVTGICPGAVETEFSLVRFKGDETRANAVYDGFEPLHPEDIADAIWYAVSRPPHVNINDLVIMPTAQANTTHLLKEN
jgi:3-hydroxy acid dehydrogenase/malonic semialdehyde reductase